MSVLDFEKVDGIAYDEKNKCVRLLIADHLEWDDEYGHLVALQEKINAYIGFCEERQYEQIYKNRQVEYGVFEIHFASEPTEKAMNFLEQVQKQLNELGITIECHIG